MNSPHKRTAKERLKDEEEAVFNILLRAEEGEDGVDCMHKTCAVCLELVAPADLAGTPCTHVFCKKCLGKWIAARAGKSKVPCPTCRKDVVRYYVIDETRDTSVARVDLAQTRRHMVTIRVPAPGSDADADDDDGDDDDTDYSADWRDEDEQFMGAALLSLAALGRNARISRFNN